jgi:hypothetical protein
MANEYIWCNLDWALLSDGVSVVKIHANSPLSQHLIPGVRIFQLDDTLLSHGPDDWRTFWSMGFSKTPTKGFCTVMDAKTNDTSCCEFASDLPFGNLTDTMVSCFQNISLGNVKVV